MKALTIAALLAAMLLAAGTAQAYAIYNHTDSFCGLFKDSWHSERHGIARPHHHLNGSHGSKLDNAFVECCDICSKNKQCWISDKFDIPKGGYARVYYDKVKVYKHSGKHTHTVSMEEQDFSWDNDCANELDADPNYWCN